MAGINLRKIKIGDSSELRACGLMSGTLSVVEADIRGFVASRMTDVLIAQDESIRAVVKLFRRDRKMSTVQLEFVYTEDADMDTKSEIMAAIAEAAGISKKQAVAAYDELLKIAYAGAKGPKGIMLPGLGKMLKAKSKARLGRNPATGETIKIPARTKAKFRLCKAAKDAVLA